MPGDAEEIINHESSIQRLPATDYRLLLFIPEGRKNTFGVSRRPSGGLLAYHAIGEERKTSRSEMGMVPRGTPKSALTLRVHNSILDDEGAG